MMHAPCFERRHDDALACKRTSVALAWSPDDRAVALWPNGYGPSGDDRTVEVVAVERAASPGASVILGGEDPVRAVCFAGPSALLVLRDSATDAVAHSIERALHGERTLRLHALPGGGAVASFRAAEISRTASLQATADGARCLVSSPLRWTRSPDQRTATRWFHLDRELRVLASPDPEALAAFFLDAMGPRAQGAAWSLDARLDASGDALLVRFCEEPSCGGARWMSRYDSLRGVNTKLDTAGFDEGVTLPAGLGRFIDVSQNGDAVRVTEVRDGAASRVVYARGDARDRWALRRWWTLPTLSPGGARLLFATEAFDGGAHDARDEQRDALHVLDLSRGEVIARCPAPSGACWIDDGRLALATRDGSGAVRLAILSLHDGGVRPWCDLGVEVEVDVEVSLTRSPGGRWIEVTAGWVDTRCVLLLPMPDA